MTKQIKFYLCFLLGILFMNSVAAQIPTGGSHFEEYHDLSNFIVSETTVSIAGENFRQVKFNGQDLIDDYYLGSSPIPTQFRYLWSFGDGNVSYELDPTHLYNVNGEFDVSFHATPIYSPQGPPPSMRVDDPLVVDLLSPGTPNVSATSYGFMENTTTGIAIRTELERELVGQHESCLIVTYKNTNNSGPSLSDNIEVYFDSNELNIVAVYNFSDLESVNNIGNIPASSPLAPGLGQNTDSALNISFGNLAPEETRRILIFFELKVASAPLSLPVFFGANFSNNSVSEAASTRGSVRRSWDPNAKEVFIDHIDLNDIPEDITYRIHMENEGDAHTNKIRVVDYVADVLMLDNNIDPITDQKGNSDWLIEDVNIGERYVQMYGDVLLAPRESEDYTLDESKYWIDVTYPLDGNQLIDIINSGAECRDGFYYFGKPADIEFDDSNVWHLTNTPLTKVSCGGEGEHGYCANLYDISPNPVEEMGTVKYELSSSYDYTFDAIAISAYGEMTQIAEGLSPVQGAHKYDLNFGMLEKGVYQLILTSKQCTSNSYSFVKK